MSALKSFLLFREMSVLDLNVCIRERDVCLLERNVNIKEVSLLERESCLY